MARPTKSSDERMTERIEVRFTPEEMAHVRLLCRAAGRTPSDLLRLLIRAARTEWLTTGFAWSGVAIEDRDAPLS